MNRLEFRLLAGDDINQTYAVLRDRFHWMQARGLPHDGLTAFSEIVARQQRKENFGLIEHGQVLSTICVKQDQTHPEDSKWVPPGNHWWIFSLATHPAAAGRGLGPLILRKAIAYLSTRQVETVFLDCLDGNGFLPRFYCEQGFQRLGQKWVDQGGAHLVPMSIFSARISTGNRLARDRSVLV